MVFLHAAKGRIDDAFLEIRVVGLEPVVGDELGEFHDLGHAARVPAGAGIECQELLDCAPDILRPAHVAPGQVSEAKEANGVPRPVHKPAGTWRLMRDAIGVLRGALMASLKDAIGIPLNGPENRAFQPKYRGRGSAYRVLL